MRPLEITIPFLLAIYLLWPVLVGRRPVGVRFLPAAALVVSLVHIVVEGYRWQMIPLYSLTLILVFLSAISLAGKRGTRKHSRISAIPGTVLGLALLAVAIALPIILPVPQLPQPTGAYKIGTEVFPLVDESRREIYSGDPNEPRRIMVQIWYPAQPARGAQPGPWIEGIEEIGPLLLERLGGDGLDIPPWFTSHLSLARTHSYPGAPLAQGGPFPVLLFSHGWTGFRVQNTFQVEELASHGYVVVGLDHTYGAGAVRFPDGTLSVLNPDTLPSQLKGQAYRQAANRLVDQWAGDLGLVLDRLEELNQGDSGDRWTGQLDLSRVGVFGHSTGGGATVEFCARDPRCQAGLGMDAYLAPVSDAAINSGLQQPFFFFYSEGWPSASNTALFSSLFAAMDGPVYAATLLGTEHYDFSDLPMLSPLAHRFGLKGPLPTPRVMRVVNDYSLSFFHKFLIDETAPFPPAGDYTEVK